MINIFTTLTQLSNKIGKKQTQTRNITLTECVIRTSILPTDSLDNSCVPRLKKLQDGMLKNDP